MQTATASFTVTITLTAIGLNITTASLNSGVLNAAYSQTLTATGGKSPYTWQLTAGTLPAGLTFNALTGVIGGTPTIVVTASPLTFKVTDSSSPAQSATASFTLTIAAAPPPGLLTILTTSLNAGVVGTAYSQTLAATGGTGPYTWKLAAGRLPYGLTLNPTTGEISGTPTSEVGGSYLTFQVTDAGSPMQTATASLIVTIKSGL
jgi:hypothetical protein